ncbi:MAG: competence type IV pilus assembly protein ComGB [Lactococcus sp.]
MKRLMRLLQTDISQFLKLKRKKLSLDKQAKLIQLMGNLLSNGFHLGEVVDFLERSHLVEKTFVQNMKMGLKSGQNLSSILEKLNFSHSVLTQISLAEQHGNLAGTLQLIEVNVRKKLQIQRKLIGILMYPILLITLLIGIMLGLKNYLLPQISDGQDNLLTQTISHLPSIFLLSLLFILILSGLTKYFLRKKKAIFKVLLMTKIPFLSEVVKLYLTGYFSREWGNLIAQGVDLQEIFYLMSQQKSPIFSETGDLLLKKLNSGTSFGKSVNQMRFFKPELALMIEYGELKDKLGLELEVYAEECWEQFFLKIERAIQLIQPLVFIFIALMIVLLYAGMLMPIYSNMGQMM